MHYLYYIGWIMDNGSRWEIRERSLNSSQVSYIYLCINTLGENYESPLNYGLNRANWTLHSWLTTSLGDRHLWIQKMYIALVKHIQLRKGLVFTMTIISTAVSLFPFYISIQGPVATQCSVTEWSVLWMSEVKVGTEDWG